MKKRVGKYTHFLKAFGPRNAVNPFVLMM